MDVITVVLASLATARITRLITADKVTERLRFAIIRRVKDDGMLAYLIVCDWCASIYVGSAVAGAWMMWGDTTLFTTITLALSASYAAGFLNSKADD